MSIASIQAKLEEIKRKQRLKVPISKRLKKAGIAVNPTMVEEIRKKLVPLRHTNLHHTVDKRVSAKRGEIALAEHLAGKSQKDVEEKYGLSSGYVAHALKRMFPDRAKMEEVLENIVLNNAVLANAVFGATAPEMSGRDAAIASGIFTQRFIDLKKAKTTGYQDNLPVHLVVQLSQTMERLEKKADARLIEDEE